MKFAAAGADRRGETVVDPLVSFPEFYYLPVAQKIHPDVADLEVSFIVFVHEADVAVGLHSVPVKRVLIAAVLEDKTVG